MVDYRADIEKLINNIERSECLKSLHFNHGSAIGYICCAYKAYEINYDEMVEYKKITLDTSYIVLERIYETEMPKEDAIELAHFETYGREK